MTEKNSNLRIQVGLILICQHYPPTFETKKQVEEPDARRTSAASVFLLAPRHELVGLFAEVGVAQRVAWRETRARTPKGDEKGPANFLNIG